MDIHFIVIYTYIIRKKYMVADMKGYTVDIDRIRDRIRDEQFAFTFHATEERLRKNITTDVVCEAILNGIVAKIEKEEKSKGKLKKYTIDWKNFRVVVKNDETPLIISLRVKN